MAFALIDSPLAAPYGPARLIRAPYAGAALQERRAQLALVGKARRGRLLYFRSSNIQPIVGVFSFALEGQGETRCM